MTFQTFIDIGLDPIVFCCPFCLPSFEEPDFLSTPRWEENTIINSETESTTHSVPFLKRGSETLASLSKLYNPKYTDSSVERTTSAGSVLEDTSMHKRKKVFFISKKKELKPVIGNNSVTNEKIRCLYRALSMNIQTS
ncbi:CFC_HP_G0063260.mRNA.1.CDS.1 [Saccharomyces cerevisiae]|nr:CFC_HP_G0063260.mRNA.1.CDS.1 [Saccharomyces cerevisiae]CAI6599354.1 CFC_HP_G0063260.mRNA.1.CDS.1 [Saccharomyces cerevisiae]